MTKKEYIIYYWWKPEMGGKIQDIYLPDMDYYLSIATAYKDFKDKNKDKNIISIKIKRL